MKIVLENREFDFVANGNFLRKFQNEFKEEGNFVIALYKSISERDLLTTAKLVYCGIDVEESFDEWIDSFETPLFLMAEQERVNEYLARTTKPTVEAKNSTSSKKKTI